MTKRADKPKHTRASLEVEKARIEREEAERQLIAAKRSFKARPAPPETSFPLYHDLVEQSETRRAVVRDMRKAEIAKIVKPFSFDRRDQQRAREKARKLREQREEEDNLVKATSSMFTAMELDRSILDKSIDWETAEMERKRRIQQRSERTMRSASAGRQKTTRKKPAREEEIITRVKPTPVPNFVDIHKREQAKMERTKALAESERAKRPKSAAPTLYSAKRAEAKPKQPEEPIDNNFRSTKIAYKPEPLPIKENKVYLQRKKVVNETLDLLERTIQEEKMKEKKRKQQARTKSAELKRKLPKNTTNAQRRDKVKQLLREDKQRQQEYEQSLNDIYTKVSSQPLLFERSLTACRDS